jgi:hypothetical protein
MTGQPDEYRTTRFVGVGCVTAVAGLFSGGMTGVLVAKIVGGLRRCEAPTGLPACDWHVYAGIGMLIGLITLPVLALNRLRRREQAAGERD